MSLDVNTGPVCAYCRAPITDTACLVCGGTGHRPEAVLEMPRGEFWWCIKCSKPWPCPDAPDVTR